MVYQLKYDTAQGKYQGKIERSEDGKFLIVDGKKIAINQEFSIFIVHKIMIIIDDNQNE